MSESVRMWSEITFNTFYLIFIWAIVFLMETRKETVDPTDRSVSQRIKWAFFLLALGDTGHVGFRILGYGLEDLETTVNIFGNQITLVGLGALSTAVTVTLFYVLILEAWRLRYQKNYGWFEYLLLLAAVIRLALFFHPGNQWGGIIPPFEWSMYRNIPLILQGLGVAYLILRDASKTDDRVFRLIGYMILISYACYLPVILWVQQNSLVGMLMIPKTMAYIAIAYIAYKNFWNPEDYTGS